LVVRFATHDVHAQRAAATHDATSQDDDEVVIEIRKGALKSICDAVERAHAATKHAVHLASSARDQFETEERVLSDTVRKLQRLVDNC
jgi:hypothetical protein